MCNMFLFLRHQQESVQMGGIFCRTAFQWTKLNSRQLQFDVSLFAYYAVDFLKTPYDKNVYLQCAEEPELGRRFNLLHGMIAQTT